MKAKERQSTKNEFTILNFKTQTVNGHILVGVFSHLHNTKNTEIIVLFRFWRENMEFVVKEEAAAPGAAAGAAAAAVASTTNVDVDVGVGVDVNADDNSKFKRQDYWDARFQTEEE